MRIAIVYNPRSGRGRAQRLADAIADRARSRGHTMHAHDISTAGGPPEHDIAEADRLVIVGGDGTVHHLLPQLARTQTPFYHAATGTANLIAHALRMPSKPARILPLLEHDTQPVRIDLPLCNGKPFIIMTSLGMDASVIHRLEESRTLGGYRAYIRPVAREILSPRFAHAKVELDHQHAPNLSRPGILVIANMPNYGGHFNPCPRARWNDGQLDIAHIPGTSSITSGLRYLALLARLPAATTGRAGHITLTATTPSPIQIDGEKPTQLPSTLAPDQRLEFTLSTQSIVAHAPRLSPD